MAVQKQHSKGESLWRLAVRRFKKNTLAFVALGFLLLEIVITLGAYFFISDKTQHANAQTLILAKSPPGTHAAILLKPLPVQKEEKSWLIRKLYGTQDNFERIPLADENSWKIQGDTLQYTTLRGESITTYLPLFMLPIQKNDSRSQAWQRKTGRPYLLQGNEITFISKLQKSPQVIPLMKLQNTFPETHLSQKQFLLGTDGSGRDILSRLILGGRVSLAVGFLAVLVSLGIGVLLGALAGFFGGRVDKIILWFISVIWSLPTLLLAIALAFVMGKGFAQLFIAIGLSMWVEIARIVRGQILVIKAQQYVEATKVLGFSSFRALFRHVLPNTLSPLLIVAAANFAAAILIEAGLSFLGIGIRAPVPSWGNMLREGYDQIMFESGSWLAIFPGLAIVLTVISLNLVGLGLRDALDPKHEA